MKAKKEAKEKEKKELVTSVGKDGNKTAKADPSNQETSGKEPSDAMNTDDNKADLTTESNDPAAAGDNPKETTDEAMEEQGDNNLESKVEDETTMDEDEDEDVIDVDVDAADIALTPSKMRGSPRGRGAQRARRGRRGRH